MFYPLTQNLPFTRNLFALLHFQINLKKNKLHLIFTFFFFGAPQASPHNVA